MNGDPDSYWTAAHVAELISSIEPSIEEGRWSRLELSSFLDPSWTRDVALPASALLVGSWPAGGAPSSAIAAGLEAAMAAQQAAHVAATGEPADHGSVFVQRMAGSWFLAVG